MGVAIQINFNMIENSVNNSLVMERSFSDDLKVRFVDNDGATPAFTPINFEEQNYIKELPLLIPQNLNTKYQTPAELHAYEPTFFEISKQFGRAAEKSSSKLINSGFKVTQSIAQTGTDFATELLNSPDTRKETWDNSISVISNVLHGVTSYAGDIFTNPDRLIKDTVGQGFVSAIDFVNDGKKAIENYKKEAELGQGATYLGDGFPKALIAVAAMSPMGKSTKILDGTIPNNIPKSTSNINKSYFSNKDPFIDNVNNKKIIESLDEANLFGAITFYGTVSSREELFKSINDFIPLSAGKGNKVIMIDPRVDTSNLLHYLTAFGDKNAHFLELSVGRFNYASPYSYVSEGYSPTMIFTSSNFDKLDYSMLAYIAQDLNDFTYQSIFHNHPRGRPDLSDGDIFYSKDVGLKSGLIGHVDKTKDQHEIVVSRWTNNSRNLSDTGSSRTPLIPDDYDGDFFDQSNSNPPPLDVFKKSYFGG